MSPEKHSITVLRRLRPLRLAYLLHPDDGAGLRKIFEVNTCLWGGRFNGIVPVLRRTPRWWSDRRFGLPSADEIFKGYLDAFEPDFVVAVQPDIADHVDVDAERLIGIDDVLSKDREDNVAYGLSVVRLFEELYRREYRFHTKDRQPIYLPAMADRRLQLFGSACFGAFPVGDAFSYFTEAYRGYFDCEDVTVDGTNFFDLRGTSTPIKMGSRSLKVLWPGPPSEPALYLLDATEPRDLIDFWNLRAMGWRVLPIPKQWKELLVDGCRRYVSEMHVPYKHNPKMMHSTVLLRSRSIQESEASAFAKRIRVPGNHPLSVQHWYPRLWSKWARVHDHVQRCNLVAEEGEVECAVEEGRVRFSSLSPRFAEYFGGGGKPRWVNVIHVRDYWPGTETAMVLPPGLANLNRLLDTFSPDATSVSSEGIIIKCAHPVLRHYWRLPDGLSIFRSWLGGRGMNARLSGAGANSLQLIRALGGAWGVRAVAHPAIIELLNKMAEGQVESITEGANEGGRKVKVRSRLVSRQELRGCLMKVTGNDANEAERRLEFLAARGIIKIGLRIECSECSKRNWYPIEDIAEEVRCDRCLKVFHFPVASPDSTVWRYRTQGAFSSGDYAQGGYSVALALKFLKETVDARTTWAPGIEITDASGVAVEVDLAMWRNEERWDQSEPLLVLVECKSYGEFDKHDVSRANKLGKKFPGSVLGFVTLREELQRSERGRLQTLARHGRRQLRRGEQLRNPVLILTGHELMNDMGPPYCWRNIGERAEPIAQRYQGHHGLLELCDATQQLHLGLEPYHEWVEQHFKRKREVRERRRAKPRGASGLPARV